MSSPTSVNENPSSSGEPPTAQEERSALLDREVPPLIQRGLDVHRRDLPELLKRHKGRWVAYHGDKRIAMGRSKAKLCQQCIAAGIPEFEYVVLLVDHEPPDELEDRGCTEFD